MRRGAGLTTICAALVVPLRAAPGTAAAGRRYAVCVVAVGDSLAFVRSRRHGVREVTAGSRDLDVARDIRNAGGALGPVHGGRDPELQNLTCAITLVDAGDIVFLTSDGVSDNFDPVVAGSAVAVKKPAPPETRAPKEGRSSFSREKPSISDSVAVVFSTEGINFEPYTDFVNDFVVLFHTRTVKIRFGSKKFIILYIII